MSKVYFQNKDEKSGTVSTVKTDFPLIRYEEELLKRVAVHDAKNNPSGIDLFKDKFCSLCWRKTEMHAMTIKMVKPEENKHHESHVTGKFSGEVNSLQYDLSCLREYIEDFKLGTKAIPSDYKKLFEDAAEIVGHIFKAMALPRSVENHTLVDDLLAIHAPNYVPVDIPSGTTINKWELLFCVMEQLCVSGWTKEKIPAFSALSRQPNTNFCSEHNQLKDSKSRRLYQRDIKFKNAFHAKSLEIMINEKIVLNFFVDNVEWLWSKPVSTRVIERIRKEAYNSIMRQRSCTEPILEMHSRGIRQREIIEELVKDGRLNRRTARQVVSNTIRRDRDRLDTILKIQGLKSDVMEDVEIAKSLGLSILMVKRLLEAGHGTLLAQSKETTQWDK